MIKQVTNWLKRHAKIAKIGAFLIFLGVYGDFVRGLQRDLDEVHYSREINEKEKAHAQEIKELEKTYAKEIEEYQLKVNTLREEKLNLKMDQFQLMEKVWGKNVKNQVEMEVSDENK